MKRILSIALGFSVFATASVFAADGYVTGNVYLRAGPDQGYPDVAMIRVGTPVAVEGCVNGWSWCDVATGGDRGWMEGNYLQEDYQGQRVLVPEYGVRIGIPIVSFVFDTYWADHYRNRSWYSDRTHWSRVVPRYEPATVRGGSHGYSHGVARDDAHSPAALTRSEVAVTARSSYQGKPTHTVVVQRTTTENVRSSHYAKPAKSNVPKYATASQTPTTHQATQRTTPQKESPPGPPSDKKNRGNNDQH
ncbi:MAG TPA: SH3 domain-containing protein [Rhodanobacteraceae bacterium]|nr:SH3 domain-containing protein [Rhodanobacteraceae bacterium]